MVVSILWSIKPSSIMNSSIVSYQSRWWICDEYLVRSFSSAPNNPHFAGVADVKKPSRMYRWGSSCSVGMIFAWLAIRNEIYISPWYAVSQIDNITRYESIFIKQESFNAKKHTGTYHEHTVFREQVLRAVGPNLPSKLWLVWCMEYLSILCRSPPTTITTCNHWNVLSRNGSDFAWYCWWTNSCTSWDGTC